MDDERLPVAEPVTALVERVRAGDREAFLTIVRTYQQKVFMMAYAMLRNREDALDVVQETFLRLHQKIGTYRPGSGFQAWLLQIARHLAIDYYRKHLQDGREHASGLSLEEARPASDPKPAAERAVDLRQILSHGVGRLAERQQRVFVLRHYEELQFHEIAEALDISVGTAKSLHFKAVQNLKKWLTPYLGVTT
ncbi:MAG: sigma-70 family RNA polymerase sigma factor [Candidatus Aminicenantes bacterium]|nr:sigma-70 family RNA polymerase sigma factor [Candidatus Aminicenantes bacterium]